MVFDLRSSRLIAPIFALGLILLLALHIRTGLNHGRTIVGYDGQYYYATLRSMAFDRDFDFRNELRDLTPEKETIPPPQTTATGKAANKYGVGWALIALPFFMLLHYVYLPFAGSVPTGYELPYQLAATSAHVVAAWLGLVLTWRLACRYFSPWRSLFAVGAIFGGTSLFYYAYGNAAMSHSSGFCLVAVFLLLCAHLAESPAKPRPAWALLGVVGGLLLTTRYSNAVVAPLLLYPLCAAVRCARPGSLRPLLLDLAIAAAAAAPILFIQAFMWKSVYGHWFAYSYGEEGFHWSQPQLFNYFFSHINGMAIFTPLTLLGTCGLLVACCSRRTPLPRLLAVGLTLSVLALIYLNASWHCWWFGEGFGTRSMIEVGPAIAVGLLILFSLKSRPARFAAIGLACLCVAWTLSLFMLLHTGKLASDGSTTLPQIIQALIAAIGLGS